MTTQSPPTERNATGDYRRVGVEIEFAGLPPRTTAELIHRLFGGQLEASSPHRLWVHNTQWGDFRIELDSQYAHPDERIMHPSTSDDSEWERVRKEFHGRIRELIGDVATGLVPTEIVCPPTPWNALGALDNLFHVLREHGAKGTDASLLYGFGLHLNPELPSLSVDTILAHIRAYLLLATWLRDQIQVDITREVLPHANPFPYDYSSLVLAPDYAPNLPTLIDDYLHYNPTRNRELDLLPLFAFVAPEHPHPLLSGPLVQPRPTFHYRLPNAQLSDPCWGVVSEWNRWLAVERLAANPKVLKQRSITYLAQHHASRWAQGCKALRRWVLGS
ncbi:amidoligase family protein [Halomonas halocynthiae]|uniref:amidoligase family protein n=1 Tax=Halomonas halocynthiae TaxID=176290 RepID=UPI000405418A|nr:amidoligase family protein [Halomonas halocynthiae]